MRIIRKWHNYNKKLGSSGWFVILVCAALASFSMIVTHVGLNTDGQLSTAHSYQYPSHVVAAWILCFPVMVGLQLWPESGLPLGLTLAFNLLVPYLVSWRIRGWLMDERHVVTCFLEHNGQIVVLRRSERVSTYQGKWAGVSGYIEEGSTPSQQAWIEIKEEAGLDADDVELVEEGLPLEVVDSEIGRKWIVPEDIGRHETVPNLREAWQRVAP